MDGVEIRASGPILGVCMAAVATSVTGHGGDVATRTRQASLVSEVAMVTDHQGRFASQFQGHLRRVGVGVRKAIPACLK